MMSNGETPHGIKISNELISNYKGASGRYLLALEEQKQAQKVTKENLKRKAIEVES